MASGAGVDGRVAASRPMTPPGRYAATARDAARSILDAPPFKTAHRPPGEFQQVADDIGRGVLAAVHWIGRLFTRGVVHPISAGSHSLFGQWSDVALVGIAVVLAAVAAIVFIRRSRPGSTREATPSSDERRGRRAAPLTAANEAWAAGELDLALRLRFEAGLEHLEEQGIVHGGASLTTTAIATEVRSPAFDELASVHTLVAYAGVAASDRDVSSAFERWPEVGEDARRAEGRQ